ncbi:MAG: siphovirus ReqiPepy6 Gp37-like family protein [Lachnospiraceae bacterium]|nr:siphovirus ReqiPepy6 Gp37-like family protein [Lachnospiraceae bacterium]
MVEMEIVYANAALIDVGAIEDADADFEVGDENNFELAFLLETWDKTVQDGGYIYVAGSEYGGKVGEFELDESNDVIYVRGYTWRGLLEHKIISPASGEDYCTASGELNEIIKAVLEEFCPGGLFVAAESSTGVSIEEYQFERYCTVNAGLTAMLEEQGYRLNLSYVPRASGGYVEVSAVQAKEYGDDWELSQDVSPMEINSVQYYRGINHLICLGSGELAEREIVHLYVQKDGSIGTTQYYTGNDEIVDVYDYSNAADAEELQNGGIERLKENMNYSEFSASVTNYDADDIMLGDTVTGVDYMTDTSISQPVVRKICKRKDGVISIEYKLKGEA